MKSFHYYQCWVSILLIFFMHEVTLAVPVIGHQISDVSTIFDSDHSEHDILSSSSSITQPLLFHDFDQDQDTLGEEDNYFSDVSVCGADQSSFLEHYLGSGKKPSSALDSSKIAHFKTIYVTWDVYKACDFNPNRSPNLEILKVKLTTKWSGFDLFPLDEESLYETFFEYPHLRQADIVDSDGVTILMESIRLEWKILFGVALAFTENINAQSKFTKDTALSIAIESGKEDWAKTLLNMKADPNIYNIDGTTPLILAYYHSSMNFFEQMVNTKGVNLDLPDKEHHATVLMHAAKYGDLEAIEILAHAGADIDLQFEPGEDATFHAAVLGHIDAVKLLRELSFRSRMTESKLKTNHHQKKGFREFEDGKIKVFRPPSPVQRPSSK